MMEGGRVEEMDVRRVGERGREYSSPSAGLFWTVA
jgi:hypothetical protein